MPGILVLSTEVSRGEDVHLVSLPAEFVANRVHGGHYTVYLRAVAVAENGYTHQVNLMMNVPSIVTEDLGKATKISGL